MDVVTLAIDDKWEAIEGQQKVVITTIQAELRTLQLNTDMMKTNLIQVQTPLATSSVALAIEESHLCSLPSATLVGIQLEAGIGIQLDLAKLPHEAL